MVIDLFRRIEVGWIVQPDMRRNRVVDALETASSSAIKAKRPV